MPLYVVAAAVAFALSAPILWFVLVADRVPHRPVSRNLTAGLEPAADVRGLVLSQSGGERILRPLMHFFARPARALSPTRMVASLDRSIQSAGKQWPVERVLVTKLVLGGALLAAGLTWAVRDPSATHLLAGLLAGVFGYLGPDVVISRLAAARQFRIATELPDTLDQLTICVEAGLGFDGALTRSAKAGRGPLAAELTRLLQDFRVGVPRTEALSNMLTRTDVPELRQFVHAVVQAEAYGVPISRTLRAQAAEQREKRRFRAEERAMKLPVKVIFPLVFCIMPTLFIIIIGPAFIRLLTDLG